MVDLASINEEYQAATVTFPFELPPHWSFPHESGLLEIAPETLWEVGTGRSQAYMMWQAAIVDAAESASANGDNDEAERLLHLLENAYDSATRQDAIEDPQGNIMTEAIEAARATDESDGVSAEADFSTLTQIVSLG
jgi:hypothetical protein